MGECLRGYKRSGLEQRMFNILTALNIPFTEQFPTRSGFVLDFLVESGSVKVDVEVDGAIFHMQRRQKDNFRDYKLRHTGYAVLRFNENFSEEEVRKKLLPLLPG
jgi:very-short-patch-repair endonuclease